jgi:hypothetical protein
MHPRLHDTCVRHGPSTRCRLDAPQRQRRNAGSPPHTAHRTPHAARRTPHAARRATGRGYSGTLLAAAYASPGVAPARQRGRVGKGWQCAQRSRTAGEHGARRTRAYHWVDSATHRKWSPWQGHRTSRERLSWERPPAVVLSCEQDSRSPRDPSVPALATILNGFTLTFPDLTGSTDPLLQANLIVPKPCDFSGERLPECAIIRPTLDEFGGCRDGQYVHGRRAVHRAVVGVLYHTDEFGQWPGMAPNAGACRFWSGMVG